ncbi:phosphoadenylyl-sulfate reductase [Zafaria sp. Z1313]|uniref:phosphoadenylyl-sulfate reductase n=1 Tax=unclassified Zafaria TaxID=2828765 RepID=UPI002E79B2F0|nr:phosphoadenylyl-sulfate reductase [Zafaria sp. J156]MEE1620631.1 phosphoadenylyl-sulfate reductase [Zafaria sp. J156]
MSARELLTGRPSEALDRDRALAARGAEVLGWDAPAEEVIAWVAGHFATSEAAVACSMADAVLPALVADRLPGVDVLFLETGYHFTETHAARDEVAEALDVNIVEVLPRQSVAEQDAEHGPRLHERNPGECCRLRKMEPLARALKGYRVWFTGVRREEAPTRVDTPLVTWDEAHGLVKVNPLAGWSFEQLVSYAGEHQVPVNLLLAHGYPSIGCAPCTRPVAPGEDPRSGRWAGLNKTECGIHR